MDQRLFDSRTHVLCTTLRWGNGAQYKERLNMDQVRGWLEERGRMAGLSPGSWSSNSIAELAGKLWHPLMLARMLDTWRKTTCGL